MFDARIAFQRQTENAPGEAELMRILCVLILAINISACASHHRRPSPEYQPPVTQLDPPTKEHCEALIQDIIDHMNLVDFNKDRRTEATKYVAKARLEESRGRFDKCVSYAKKAIYWPR